MEERLAHQGCQNTTKNSVMLKSPGIIRMGIYKGSFMYKNIYICAWNNTPGGGVVEKKKSCLRTLLNIKVFVL